MTPGKHSRASAGAADAGRWGPGTPEAAREGAAEHSAACRHHAHLSRKQPQAAEPLAERWPTGQEIY